MAGWASTVTQKEFKNWLKGSLALRFTKDGLTDFVSAEVDRHHQRLLQLVPAANMLNTCNCRIKSLPQCTRGRNHSHIIPGPKQLCSRGVCNILMDAICKDHRFRAPSWKNTDPQKWCTDAFEVAKCYMPPDGYSHTTSFFETDFNGIMTVIIQNLYFSTKIQDNLATEPNICTRARNVGREIRHTADQTLSDSDLRDYIDDFINLLCDPAYLLNDPSAQDAVRKLRMLKANDLIIHEKDITEALTDNIKERLNDEPEDLLQMKHCIGTLGGFIEDPVHREFALTCAHVISDEKSAFVTVVAGTFRDSHIDAPLHDTVLIKLDKRHPIDGSFLDMEPDDVLPEEILKRDEKARDIFKRALQYGKETDRSIRLMIVGHAGVGKTTLSEHILGHSQNTTNPIKSTNGIDVHIKRCNVQLDTGAWLPVNEDSQQRNLYQRLASTLRAFSDQKKEQNVTTRESQKHESDKPPKSINDSKEGSVQTASEPDKLIYERVKVDRSSKGEPGETEAEFLEVIQEIKKQCTSVDNNTCDVSVWDFAGQYVFYCTHQVFLSRRAIYLLVTDLSKHIDSDVQDECYVDCDGVKTCKLSEFITFWLNSIYTYCGAGNTSKPFVIIVGTFADKLPKDKRKESAIKFFTALRENLVDTPTFGYLVDEDFDINNMIQDPQIDLLKRKIVEVAMNQKWWHEKIPIKWVGLERILGNCKEAGKKVLRRDTLNVLNQQLTVPIDSEEELELFLSFYHDTGIIMYFSDDSLRDFILLDPQWLVDAFKTLITADQFCSKQQKRLQMWRDFRKTAILRMDFIDCLWKSEGNEEFWENKSILLQFMEKLGIIARPVTENLIEGQHIEKEFLVPCMLKEAPTKDLISPLHNKSEQCKITSIICFASKTNLIPPHLFNKLIAACICLWRTATIEGKLALFCGFAQFEMEDHEHFLSLLFVNNCIQMWLNKYTVSGNEEPDQQICAAVKIFIERKLHQEIKEKFPVTVFWKCSQDESNSVENMIPFDELLKQKNHRCSVHTGWHVITSSELRFWIHNQGKSDTPCVVHGKETVNSFIYTTSSNCNRGLFLDTQGQEETVWMSKAKATIAQGVCKIYTLSGTGTGFRVGPCYVMTASHVVKTLVEHEGSRITGCYAIFNCLHETEITEENKFFFKDLVFFNEHLDTAVLELEPRSEKPFPEHFSYFTAPVYHNFFLIGHSKGAVMATNPVDKHVELNETNTTYLHKLQERSFQTYKLNYDYDNPHLKNVLNSDRILFHCKFVHGASGAPGVFINDKDVVVTTMLLGGYPVWYYDDIKKSWPPEDCVEQGVNMQSLYRAMKIENLTLCQEIFGQTIKYMAID